MSTSLIVILLSIGAVGIFVLGLSLTLIFKGHHIKSEIGDNENMKRLGLKCAAQQMRDEERAYRGRNNEPGCPLPEDCSTGGCGSCSYTTTD